MELFATIPSVSLNGEQIKFLQKKFKKNMDLKKQIKKMNIEEQDSLKDEVKISTKLFKKL